MKSPLPRTKLPLPGLPAGRVLALGLFLAAGAFAQPARAEDVLWDLKFASLAPGTPLEAGDNAVDKPDGVSTDPDNTLTIAKSFSGLTHPVLAFKKATKKPYAPQFVLHTPRDRPLSSGVLTFTWSMVLDDLVYNAKNQDGTLKAIENLMGFGFMKQGGSFARTYTVLAGEDSSLSLGDGATGHKEDRFVFAEGQVVQVRIVLDLNAHTLQLFANGAPVGSPVHDEQNLDQFFGVRFTDGTSIGGNYGSTFTAGFDEIKVTRK